MRLFVATTVLFALGVCAGASPALTLELAPAADNTLYEAAPETLATSNGAGVHLFAGTTDQGKLRRAVLRFDLSAIPALSTVEAVSVQMFMSRSRAGDTPVALHRLTADWGEGASDAFNNEGRGAAAEKGDATWQNAFHPDTPWGAPGGDFAPTASATQTVGDVGPYTWSSAGLLADVQGWVDDPAGNFGWIVIGDEASTRSAKRFGTRENTDAGQRPVLTVQYSEPLAVESGVWGSLKALFR